MNKGNTILSPATVSSVTDLDEAFGGGHKFLPAMEDIPKGIEKTPFYQLASDLFYKGVASDDLPNMTLNPDFNEVVHKVQPFINSILKSFTPKHEHKMNGVAYLLSQLMILEP
jgi:hypothetical protein